MVKMFLLVTKLSFFSTISALGHTCHKSEPKTLIIGITDQGSHDLPLAKDVRLCLEEKDSTLVIVLSPNYYGTPESLQVYKETAKKVINIFYLRSAGMKLGEAIYHIIKQDCGREIERKRRSFDSNPDLIVSQEKESKPMKNNSLSSLFTIEDFEDY